MPGRANARLTLAFASMNKNLDIAILSVGSKFWLHDNNNQERSRFKGFQGVKMAPPVGEVDLANHVSDAKLEPRKNFQL